jgi:RNA polymerase sigma factor (sigma-70 family)
VGLLFSMLEREIIEGCKKGVSSSQEALYTRYAPTLRMICFRYIKDRNEAEDVFHEALIKIFSNIQSYSNQGSFEGWLKKITIHVAIDYYKKSIRTKNLENEVLENFYSGTQEQEEENDFEKAAGNLSLQQLLSIINKLPEGYGIVFNLFAIEGYSHKDISNMLHISEGTSKSQLLKARKYLKKLISEYSIKEDGGEIIQNR